MNEPKNLKEHQIKKKKLISNEPQISKETHITNKL